MGYRRRVCAAISIAAAFIVCALCFPIGPACAEEDDDPHAMQFSGRDIWRNGAFAYAGLLLAPGGFERDGLMLKIVTSGGLYRYYAGSLGGERVLGAEWLADVLPGFRIKRGNAEFKVFFGPELQRHKLWPDDPGNRLRGNQFGVRFAGELWYEPTPMTLIAGDVALASVATSSSARLAYGWRVDQDLFSDGIYVGPEVQYFGSDGYRQFRIGLHITSMKTETTEWSAAAGWARDSDGQTSPYLRLNMSQKL